LLRSVGYDHVDLEKAALLGMRVANVPEYSPYSVAEHAVAMLMAANRKIVHGQQLMSLQDFRIDSLKGFDIHGKVVGVIGTGKIGMAFSRIMIGFGAHVLAYDPQINQEAIDIGIKYESLEALLRKSDIVSLHCPLSSGTRHLISGTQFSWMKPGAILINTSRGAVINTDDLLIALDSGKLGGVCLDVYEFEKGLFFVDHRNDIIHDVAYARLKNFKNALLTSHQGFLTEDAVKQIAETTFSNLDCFDKGLPCRNEITTSQQTVLSR
jgi:D-lactate dehydrogenase